MEKNLSSRTQKMVQLAILVAIMLIFAYTPLGYLKVGAIEITFMVLPVAIGTIIPVSYTHLALIFRAAVSFYLSKF